MKNLLDFITEQLEIPANGRFNINDRRISDAELDEYMIIHTSREEFLESINSDGIRAFAGNDRVDNVHQDAPPAVFAMLVKDLKDAWGYGEEGRVFLELNKKYAKTLEWFEDGVEKFPAIYTMNDIPDDKFIRRFK